MQDAPRYGAERRGAPIFATVRAAHAPIQARGLVQRPDLVLLAEIQARVDASWEAVEEAQTV